MEFVEHENDRPEPISIARCRELLGEKAETMTDQEIALMRRHAETMACIVGGIHVYLKCRFAKARPEPDFKYRSNSTARS